MLSHHFIYRKPRWIRTIRLLLFGFLAFLFVLTLIVARSISELSHAHAILIPQPSQLYISYDREQSYAAKSSPSTPLMFIENVGQLDESVHFEMNIHGNTIRLGDDALWITILEPSDQVSQSRDFAGKHVIPFPDLINPRSGTGVNVRLSFIGANPNPRLEPFGRLNTRVSYFIGNKPDKWFTDIPVWGGVRYVNLYPNLDLEITGEDGQLVTRLVCHSDCEFSLPSVGLRIEGAEALQLHPISATGETSDIRLVTGAGEFTFPLAKVIGKDGTSLSPPSPPIVSGSDIIAPFSSLYDGMKKQVGDRPHQNQGDSDLLYSTYLGGYGGDVGRGIAVDGDGHVYVSGYTHSADFPTTPGAFDTIYSDREAFVIKVDPSTGDLVYATFLGGNTWDYGTTIAVDKVGSAYITGYTFSTNFPTTPGAYDTIFNGGATDVFVTKLNASGNGLQYSTFLGGRTDDIGIDIKVDATNNVYVTGTTESSDFPTTDGAYDTSFGGGICGGPTNARPCADAFIVKLNTSGSEQVYSTYLGDYGFDFSSAIAIDGGGNAYITGHAGSSSFPTTPGAFDRTINGDYDTFATKLDVSGSKLVYATFLGGAGYVVGNSIAVDSAGSAYVTGRTGSGNFTTTPGAYDTVLDGDTDAFVLKLNASGTQLAYSTFLGGAYSESAAGIVVDSSGGTYIVGSTASNDFPTTDGAFDTYYNGGGDAFVVKLNASGTELDYATFFGGSSGEGGAEIVVESGGEAYFTGSTRSYDLPITQDAFDKVLDKFGDAFVVKLEIGAGISIPQIEVTQAIQDSNNNVPLIANKPTIVRVYPECAGGCQGKTGLLRGYGGANELPGSPLHPHRHVEENHDDLQDQRSDLRKTLNFTLPQEWTTEGEITLTAEISDAQESRTLEFVKGNPLRIAWVLIPYKNFIGATFYPDPMVAHEASDFMRKIYPLGYNDLEYIFQPGVAETVNVIKFSPHSANLYLKALRRYWRSTTSKGGWQEGIIPDRLYGWIPGQARVPGGVCGVADSLWAGGEGRVALGADYCDKRLEGQLIQVSPSQVIAHEIGHIQNQYGLKHAPNEGPASDPNCFLESWDPDENYPIYNSYPRGSIGEYGVDVLNDYLLLSPVDTYDFMSYCQKNWISPHNYTKLINGFAVPDTDFNNLTSVEPTRQLLVSGMVYSPTLHVEFDPFYAITSTVPPDSSMTGHYCLDLLDSYASILDSRCFELSFVNPKSGESTDADAFVMAIPYPMDTAEVRLNHLNTPIGSIEVSPHGPTVTLTSPNGGEVWSGTSTYTVTWSASDADGDPLFFALDYSTDAGQTWIPLGVDITTTSHPLDVSLLPGGSEVLLRVNASDGINTGYDLANGLITVGRKPPISLIVAPEEDVTIHPGIPIFLDGYAYDLEDGVLADNSYSWRSDLTGHLGVGKRLLVSLPSGHHTITLTVIDSDTNSSTSAISVTVHQELFLPVVQR